MDRYKKGKETLMPGMIFRIKSGEARTRVETRLDAWKVFQEVDAQTGGKG